MPRLSTSTWSLHRNLGPVYGPAEDGSDRIVPTTDAPASAALLDVPARIADQGIGTLEICHFHFPSTDSGYVSELRGALDDAGVELFSLLIDAGDITNSDEARRSADLAWIRSWIAVAADCGASHARVIAGDSHADAGGDAVSVSSEGLLSLASFAADRGVRVITENFRALTRRPEPLLEILDRCEGRVGLCADFGNFGGRTKYDDLAAILPRADSVHAKAHYPAAGKMDRLDFVRCMDLARETGFDGPYSLIFDGPGDEWRSLGEIAAAARQYL